MDNKDKFPIVERVEDANSIFPVVADCPVDEDFSLNEQELLETEGDIPILALRNMVLFPGLVMPVLIGREQSVRLIRHIERTKGVFGAIAQYEAVVDLPDKNDLFEIGVIAELLRVIELPDGNITVILQGRQRFNLRSLDNTGSFLRGQVSLLKEVLPKRRNAEYKVLLSTIKENALTLLQHNHRNFPAEITSTLKGNDNPIYTVSFAANGLSLGLLEKQGILEIDELRERAMRVLTIQQTELQLIQLKESLQSKTREEMDRQQKEYYLQQQIRTIQEELGGNPADEEIAELKAEASKKLWTKQVADIFEKEVRKADRMHPQSPEYAIQMQYLRTVLSLPWGVYSKDNFDLKNAQKVLDKEHYGLEKVKERILEYIAVLKLKGNLKSPILCLYGPPGVGKTSLGKSIAESLGREYVRISLGGVHDEAEIRGHRRTYIGAMSGRIIQSLQKAGTSNPVFVLDEIDKISGDYKGDPAAALLEVLDPEQNTAFHDNYLDIDYDLSQVLFIATANNVGAISQPLRDRMEMIEVSGYIAEEKVQIAKKHLIPRAIEDHGLADKRIKFTPKAIDSLIENYTRESGVRGLSKQIAKVMRKMAYKEVCDGHLPVSVTPEDISAYLGKPLYSRDKYQGNELPGVVVGLAWTSVGGEILFIESSLHKGTEGKLILTGNLGDVMKESAVIAMNYIRSHAEELGIPTDAFKEREVHIHVPEGAVPKDGPSAGITMVTSLVSALTRRKVRKQLAMTGEIALRGKVLPVGGIKEKILAAKRSRITDIILCAENSKDISEISQSYLKGLTFHYVTEIKQVLKIALTDEVVD